MKKSLAAACLLVLAHSLPVMHIREAAALQEVVPPFRAVGLV
jgi:hypothetical protein